MSNPTPPYAGVLFDCDGTLADTLEVIVRSYQHAFEKMLGEKVSDEKAKSFMGLPLEVTFRQYCGDDWEEAVRVYRKFNAERLAELTKPYIGVKEMLVGLQDAKIPTGVVTSKRRGPATHTLEYAQIGGLCPVICALEDVTIHKPNPEPLLYAANQLGIDPTQMAYVGDAIFDLQAAHRAGMDAIAVTWGAADRATLAKENPEKSFDTPHDLAAYLLGKTS